ncbi:MAG: adenylate/guanylate cyclase domain-containing protein [Fibrobacteria bacterium]|nr:adenylate/guanylate cyclase domain-containing protein [Fibrobacteria bacterium]
MPWKERFGVGGSASRLESLIAQRSSAAPEEKERLDRRIWDLFGETWTIMFTDLAGFSRQVARFGIIHFLQTIYESEKLLFPVIEAHDGIVLKVEGDSFMVLFRNPHKALQAAQAMNEVLDEWNTERPHEELVLLCLGLGYGRVLRIGDHDVFGSEVNAASKLGEDEARAGEILATDAFVKEVGLPPERLEALAKAPPGADRAWRIVGA